MNQDQEHLRLLSIFYYVYAGLIALAACFFALYLVIGLALLVNPEVLGPRHDDPDGISDVAVAIVGACLSLFGAALATCLAIAGRSLSQKKRHTFCLVMAGFSCILVPIGTVLGVFSLIVLIRPSVKALFNRITPLPPAYNA